MMMAKEVSRALAHRAEDIARYLLPNGKKSGAEWRVGSVDGENGKSLGVHLTGEKAGVWSDFANGESGDLLDLWAITRHLTLAEAIKDAIRYLGISLPKFEAYKSSNYVKPKLKNVTELDLLSPVMNYLVNERKLSVETIRAYKIGECNRDIIFPYWRHDELVFIKYLKLERDGNKKNISVEANCEPCLFGWHHIPPDARSVVICEGEIDAMTLYQYGLPALSVPFGGGGGNKQRWIEYNLPLI
jgi:twinkle protein